MIKEQFALWCTKLMQLNVCNRWRSLVVLSGSAQWQSELLSAYLTSNTFSKADNSSIVCFDVNQSELLPTVEAIHLKGKQFVHQLGSEHQIIIYSVTSHDDFDVDAFAALSGTLVSGGILFLLITDFEQKENRQTHYFWQRFQQILKAQGTYIVDEVKQELPKLHANEDIPPNNNTLDTELLPYQCVTAEQSQAVKAILTVLHGHRNRPLVLSADRGRGKSSALALAACEVFKQAELPLKIIITAASRSALNVFYAQICLSLPEAEIDKNKVVYRNCTLEYMPVDQILAQQPSVNLLMIDEAAAIPVYLLERILQNYRRLVFSSTIHGYEGAGRGFSVKFQKTLSTITPQWRSFHINQPIRWANDDPLEKLTFECCLLNAQLESLSQTSLRYELVTIESLADKNHYFNHNFQVSLLTKTELIDNETLLKTVFSVLVTAHYQTSPNDLKLLLDNPAISLIVLQHQQTILGVAMLVEEGLASEQEIALVCESKRRLKDQFLPQSLLAHCGIKNSFAFKYQRIMRIAIHPELHGLGLGSYFLSQIECISATLKADFIGSSFGGNKSLLAFWQKAGFDLARIGFSKDKASGEHSCLVIKPVQSTVFAQQTKIRQKFYQQFDYWLTDEFSQLPALLVWQVLNHSPKKQGNTISEEHQQAVNDFTAKQRQFSSCVFSLHQWLLLHCLQPFNEDVLPLISRIFQKQSVEQVCSRYSFSGKKALNQHIIEYIAKH